MKMDASEDSRYTDTIAFLRSGKHISSLDRSSGAYNYRKVMDQLCIEMYRDEVLDGCHFVVPTHKRNAILALLHAGHSGVAKTYRTAMQLYYWPNIKKDIVISISSCQPCQEQTASNPKLSMGQVNLPAPLSNPCYTRAATCFPLSGNNCCPS